jgi:hypothetical protein
MGNKISKLMYKTGKGHTLCGWDSMEEGGM